MDTKSSNYLCPVCKEKNLINLKIFFDSYQKLFRCKKCSFIFRARFVCLDEQINYHLFSASNEVKKTTLEIFKKKKPYYDHIISKIIKQRSKNISFLDIGAGTGNFLKQAFNNGIIRAIGVEPNSAECDYAKELFNMELINSYYNKNLFKAESFDVIHHSHLIEHVVDPYNFLSWNYSHLIKGGGLVFTYPPKHCLAFYKDYIIRKPSKANVIIPQHFNYFTTKSIKYLLKNIGFKNISIEYGNQYYKKNHKKYYKILKYSIDPLFRLMKFGEPYIFCEK